MKIPTYFLFKKEIRDFFSNYKCSLMVILISIIPSFYKYTKKENIPSVFFLFFILLSVGQYIYDSFVYDVNEKSMFFYENMKVPFYKQIFVKLMICFLQLLIPLIINFKLFFSYFSFFDLFWIITLIITTSLFSFDLIVITNGSELATTLLFTVFLFAFSIAIIQLSYTQKIFISLLLYSIMFFLSKKLFYSRKLRALL